MTQAQAQRSYQLEHAREDDKDRLKLRGRLDLRDASALWTELRGRVRALPGPVELDLSGAESVDGGTMALLVQLECELGAPLVGMNEQATELHRLYGGEGRPCLKEDPCAPPLLVQVGDASLEVFRGIRERVAFVGELALATARAVRTPASVRWRDVPPLMERAGADGLFIVGLINFLVGFIMAYQGARQLELFGANELVADLVGLSVTRELGPLMTAIIVCGRTGAGYAAELGTMEVSEEVSALKTLGFDPLRFLVLPRVIALMLVLPLLALIADAVGIAGGLLVGITELDLTVKAYWNQTLQAIGLVDVFSGAVKSVVFALAIALIACQQGLSAAGGAVGVGKHTTQTVVSTLFVLIVLDACFTVAFHVLGI
jgi:phospholipid/cholesterol/gamma-HCH transport system permease protein